MRPDICDSAGLSALLSEATDRLRRAGVDSPAGDARLLLAHVLGVPPNRLLVAVAVTPQDEAAFDALVTRRARRIPLQHLTGRAHFRYEEILVGPGVFVPRPETEVMTGWAIDQLRPRAVAGQGPLVVELCAGSGAVAKAMASELPGLRVHAVELAEDAARWAERNLAGSGVTLHVQDMADALPELDGQVDLVVANPPYIPLDAYESVAPEVRDHDPVLALFSGDDGLDAIRVVAETAARLLRNGGLLCVEHAEVQADSAPAALMATDAYSSVRDHVDLAGRARFVTAVRRPRSRRR